MTNRQVLEALKPHLPEISQAALAQKIGISQPSLCQFLKGTASPSYETLCKLAELAGGSFKKRLKLPGKKLLEF